MKHNTLMKNTSGQNLIEYILLLVLVISLLIIILGPNGVFTRKVDQTLNTAVNGIRTEVLRN